MKKYGSVSLILVFLLLFPAVLQSCTPAEPVVTSDITKETESETVTETETEIETETETEPEPDRFNAGKVSYKKSVIDTVIKEFPDASVGKPAKDGDDGVVKLFHSDFSDNDPTCGGKAIPRAADAAGVVDGKMYIPYSDSSEDHFSGGWTTWGPDVNISYDENKQSQLSASLNFHSANDGAWFCGYIGCFVSDFTFKIPDNPGDGVWLSFNEKENRIYVYAANGAGWKWPASNAFVTVDSELINGDTSLDVICTEDKQIYVYLKNTPVMHIICGQTVIVYDGGGNEVYSGDFDINSVSGGHYSIFVHGGGGLEIDEMSVYGCSKGIEKHEEYVTATPVGDNRLGYDITDRDNIVGICYTMWFNAIHGDGDGKIENALNVTELKEYGFSAKYGFGNKEEQHNASPAFHYWAKPAQGYYRSTDRDAIRNNMTLLYNAGVDFIILDYTYATSPGYDPGTSAWSSYIYKPSVALLDTIMEMRAEGLGTPYVVYWMGSENMFDFIYTYFYGAEKWKDCFVYWDGKPFIMNWNLNKKYKTDVFTVRSMYGLQGQVKRGQWSYLEIDNSKTVSYDANKDPEHVCACVATQETYMSAPTAHGRDGGRFFNSQWQTVFEVRPKIVTVTWWNEWCAQLLNVSGVGYVFTDNFDIEHSRDIEPMEGGHGDLYYRWLCEYIRAYRAGEECPVLIEK